MKTLLAFLLAGTISGPAFVIDGDTIVVSGVHVRLKGVDASELSDPRGIEAKLAMQGIVGTWLECELTGEKTHGRDVGWCKNAAGKDIGAEIIRAGKALSCPRYDRRYILLEQDETIARQRRAPYCLIR